MGGVFGIYREIQLSFLHKKKGFFVHLLFHFCKFLVLFFIFYFIFIHSSF